MAKRALEVVPIAVQPFESRFPGKRRRLDDDLPTISSWRCNLTGLSQKHNLLFIAYGRDIYVHVPQFPTQELQQPALIVPSQPSDPDLRGYLDSEEPHSINNLIVQFLGNEEVVATVRDDGDVEALLVRHIIQAIDRRAEPGNAFDAVADEVRPIFQSNVGTSAWGLAIHSQARIVAVSSNKHEVTVFRFALLDEYDENNVRTQAREFPLDGESEPDLRDRRTDVTHQVLNGESNIPYISFCNTTDDPDARWLLTTDISGVCRVMDLHQVTPVQAFRFGPSFAEPHSGGYDKLNAGWAIMFLDARSFQPEDSLHEALGLKDGEALPDQKQDHRIWDLTKSVSRMPDTADALIYEEPKKRQAKRRSPLRQPSTPQRSVSSPRPHDSSEDSGGVALDEARTTVSAALGAEDSLDDDNVNLAAEAAEEAAMDWQSEDDERHGGPDVVDEDDDLEGEGTEDTISLNAYYGGKRICGNRPQFVRQTNLCGDLPCPLLHASVRNIYLLQPSNQRYHQGPFAPPLVGLAQPLSQSVQVDYRYLNMFDRLNMNAYIPALGVVVFASQKGRALVLSLTKVSSYVHLPKELQSLGFKTNYAMRAEAILPFAHQEKANQRPFMPLHGIAVGPMQGTEMLPDEQKRWRLMMMYQDHSIMSYEICRRRNRDSAIALESVVV